MATGSDLQYTFVTGDFGREDLRVQHFSGTEGVSAPYSFEIEVAVRDQTIELEDHVGEDATFSWVTTGGERYVHGIIARCELTGSGKVETRYTVTLVPRLWMLSLRRQSRIFQAKTTPQILKAVLEEGGLASSQYRLSLQRSYKPRTFCVQYRETDLDFAQRLMEEEGIFYFFEQSEDGEVLRLADSNDAVNPIEGEAEISFREEDTGMEAGEHVTHLRVARSLKVGALVLKEFDFKKPDLALKSESKGESDKEKVLEAYDYPGEYPDQPLGNDLAKIRLEEERAERYLAVGDSDCRRLMPGWKFTLKEHARDEFNQDYLLLRVRHRGRQPQGEGGGHSKHIYSNAFDAIPMTTPYRPPRATPRPTIEGSQTATVVGPAGEEIHCDEHGRVKVHFHWDRLGKADEKASCWIRVSQCSGGAGWGGMFIPRIGQEVIVEFLEGDPDRPLITGRVYNGERPTPYGLPGQKMMSAIQSSTSPGGGSGNEIRFNDTHGSQEFFIHASKDHSTKVANDRVDRVTANLREQVGGMRQREVDGEESVSVTGNREETVAANVTIQEKQDESTDMVGSRTRTIGGLRFWGIGGDSKVSASGSDSLNVGAVIARLVKGDHSQETSGSARETSAVHIDLVKGDHAHESGTPYSSTVGGLIFKKSNGDIKQESDAGFLIVAAVSKIKGDNISIEAKSLITLVGGASSLVMTPAMVSVAGSKIKLDGDVAESASVIVKN